MKRLVATALILALAAPPPAAAVETRDLVAQLRAQGFARVTVTRTLLGRVRILADAGRLQREIVLNPKTGEILRDYTETAEGGSRRAEAGGDAGKTPTGTGLAGTGGADPASTAGASLGGADMGGAVGDTPRAGP